jgi:hypothetical protein
MGSWWNWVYIFCLLSKVNPHAGCRTRANTFQPKLEIRLIGEPAVEVPSSSVSPHFCLEVVVLIYSNLFRDRYSTLYVAQQDWIVVFYLST